MKKKVQLHICGIYGFYSHFDKDVSTPYSKIEMRIAASGRCKSLFSSVRPTMRIAFVYVVSAALHETLNLYMYNVYVFRVVDPVVHKLNCFSLIDTF